jgi:RNA polymerase sigma-70 factor (ECF subfamily)
MRRLTELYHRHQTMVRARARRLMGNAADAEEAVQDVFVRAMDHLPVFDSGEGTGWLYRVTTNLCLTQLRDERRRASLLQTQVQPAQASVATPDAMVTLRWLLANSDPKEARCAVYVYLDGMSHGEVAEVLDVSPRTVQNLLQRFNAWAQAALAENSRGGDESNPAEQSQ